MKVLIVLACIIACVAADVYMHNPPGSNNRVDDNNNAPANRLFNSQNNNAAGYNSGWDSHGMSLKFYEGSSLMMEWTAQHACGSNPKSNCEFIIQYRCDDAMRDGESRDRPQDNSDPIGFQPTADRGLHEPYENWYACRRRERNRGLFIADQNVGGQARHTRQNPGGGRSGYECPEERDYYPYWHPSVWKDLHILTNNVSKCAYYQAESQNVMAKGRCSIVEENNQRDCEDSGGQWTMQEAWGIDAPECSLAGTSRDNTHSFASNPGVEDNVMTHQFANVNLTIPYDQSQACVLRLRYNISTNDYDSWAADSQLNGGNSPISDDPTIDTGIGLGLDLDIDTSQYGRTFQDRTHIFEILERPTGTGGVLWNINVRGKRGNIVQTYPACEYDFVPNRLHVNSNAWVHFQWTGSNNNPQGTDRNNVVAIDNMNVNYPIVDLELNGGRTLLYDEDDTYGLATSGGSMDPELQDMPAYYMHSLIKMRKTGTFSYMSTKNNAFTNRGEKGTIIVDGSNTGMIVGLTVGGVALVAVIVGAVIFMGGASAVTGFFGSKQSKARFGNYSEANKIQGNTGVF